MRRSSNDTVYAGANDAITLGNGNDTLAFGVSPSPATIGNETVNGFNPAHDVIGFNVALLANYMAVMGATNASWIRHRHRPGSINQFISNWTLLKGGNRI
jgi:Ca2+-binding RTX toxin-like protein